MIKSNENIKNSNNITFSKLGDALSYGIINELKQHFDDDNDDILLNFNASVSFLCLNKFINVTTAKEIDTKLYVGFRREDINEYKIKFIIKILLQDLNTKLKFDDFNGLVKALNKYKLDDVYYDNSMWFMQRCLDGAFVYDESLYYIDNDRNNTVFAHIRLKDICRSEVLNILGAKNVIINNCNAILDFSYEYKKVYVSFASYNHFFYEYDMDNHALTVLAGKFFVFKEKPYVITSDGYMAYYEGGTLNRLRKIQHNEEYQLVDDGFLVVPEEVNEKYFPPYHVSFLGEVSDAPKKKIKNMIFERIVSLNNFFDSCNDKQINKIYDDPNDNIITSDDLDSFVSFKKKYPITEMRKYITFDKLVSQLKLAIPKDDDITKFLYYLYDADLRFDVEDETFPSDSLYYRVKSLVENESDCKKFIELYKSQKYDELEDFIVLESRNHEVAQSRERVGYFFYDKENFLKTFEVNLDDGMVANNMVIPPVNNNEIDGYVFYDLNTMTHYVTSSRQLTEMERTVIYNVYSTSRTFFVVRNEND